MQVETFILFGIRLKIIFLIYLRLKAHYLLKKIEYKCSHIFVNILQSKQIAKTNKHIKMSGQNCTWIGRG